YWDSSTTRPGGEPRLVDWSFEKAPRRAYRTLDPLTGEERLVPSRPRGEQHVEVSVPLDRQPRLIIVTRRRVSPEIPVDEQMAEARGERRITAEQIIAAHQRTREFQTERLRTIRREGRINFRPRYGQATGTIDLTIDGEYFWDSTTGGEWVIRDKYIGGVRLNWDEFPEIPLLRWERVIQAPLALDLDKRYRYELEQSEQVDGRDCWRVRFEPLESDTSGSLQRGRAWIDKRTAAMVKVSYVQTNLEPPLISREETRLYRPYEGPDGTEYWVLDGLDGQVIQSVAGANLVVLQEWSFGPPEINGTEFGPIRDQAYASRAQMLRDTEEGFVWLERTDSGERVAKRGKTRQWFAVGGLLNDEGADELLPLAGVNYINLDTFGRGMLFNLFFAGALANVTLSDPTFLDSKLDVALNVNALGYAGTDKTYVRGEEIVSERVKRRAQTISLTGGYPLGDFVKLRGGLSAAYINYHRDDETGAFVVPEDHTAYSGRLSLAFDRAGWGLEAGSRYTRRSSWSPWGPESALVSGDALEDAESFSVWSVVAQKTWFLPFFQQIELSADFRGGSDLDRFSAFTFGFLSGDRLRGFGGSGIRYDRGVLAQLDYEFNVRQIVQLEGTIEHARVEPLGEDEMTSHTGFGIAANFPGPKETLIRFDVGYALASDIEEVEGDLEFLLVVLKLF
ncbi:MAG: hypothetical protein JSV80_11900, partial [Acidobacteriota bacterium]